MTDCLFCKIVKNEIPAQKVMENEHFLAFNDINPQAPVHILVIPKRHRDSLAGFDGHEDLKMIGELFQGITRIAREKGLDTRGFRVVANTGNEGGQTVGHLHFHLLGGRYMNWPPG